MNLIYRAVFVFCFSVMCTLAVANDDNQVQDQMTPTQFKAAGLDKLTPDELANLNAFINGQLEETAEEVAKTAVEEHKKNNIGFLDSMFGGEAVPDIQSNIEGMFKGWQGKTRVTLANGHVWEQLSGSGELVGGVRAENPNITISQGAMGAWWAKIDGYNTKVKVKRIK